MSRTIGPWNVRDDENGDFLRVFQDVARCLKREVRCQLLPQMSDEDRKKLMSIAELLRQTSHRRSFPMDAFTLSASRTQIQLIKPTRHRVLPVSRNPTFYKGSNSGQEGPKCSVVRALEQMDNSRYDQAKKAFIEPETTSEALPTEKRPCQRSPDDDAPKELQSIPQTGSQLKVDSNNELQPGTIRELLREYSKDQHREYHRELLREHRREPLRELLRESTREPLREPLRELLREPTREPLREPTKEPTREVPYQREPQRLHHREPLRELLREPPREPPREQQTEQQRQAFQPSPATVTISMPTLNDPDDRARRAYVALVRAIRPVERSLTRAVLCPRPLVSMYFPEMFKE